MDYDVGDEWERFEEVFGDKIEKMAKPIRGALYLLAMFIFVIWMSVNNAIKTSVGEFLTQQGQWIFIILLGLLFFLVVKKLFQEEKLFENWKEGKYPDRPYDHRNYRPDS